MARVIRVGDTVRRPAGPWSPSVQALLAHVRARGVAEVPEPLGRDPQGRDVVGFVPGDVPAYPMPPWVWAPQVLDQAAGLLRRLHDATVDFPREGRAWQLAAREPAEVVCHNDVAPYNLVFRDRAVAGLIDFEAASPGPRAWDFAYLAYRLVPLTAPGNPDGIRSTEAVRAARLGRLCGAYGCGMTPDALLPVAATRLEALAAFTEARAAAGGTPELHDHVALYRADAAFLAS